MIIVKTRLTVADNSGAKKVECIAVLGSTRKRSATVGDLIKVAIKEASPTASVKKGEVKLAVVVRTKKAIRRPDGSYLRFDENSAVILNSDKDKAPAGSRIFGPVARELRAAGYMKIVSLSPEVL